MVLFILEYVGPILINTYPLDSFTVSSSSCWWLRSLAALVGLGLGLGQPFSHETPFYKYKCKYLATQLIYLKLSKGQCCFLVVVNMVTGSLGQPFSHENPSVNAALHGFHMQIHLSIIIIHLLPWWGHFCLNLTENCQSLTHQIYYKLDESLIYSPNLMPRAFREKLKHSSGSKD